MRPPAALLNRIRSEFVQTPGLKLTVPDASRLWNLNEVECRAALDVLVAEGLLRQTPSDAFIALPSARKMLKASVPDTVRYVRCPHCQHRNAIGGTGSSRSGRVADTLRCAGCSRIMNPGSASA